MLAVSKSLGAEAPPLGIVILVGADMPLGAVGMVRFARYCNGTTANQAGL